MSKTVQPLLTVPCRIKSVVTENADTFTMTIEPKDGLSKWKFEAGQFNMLYVYGMGEVPISISGDPGNSSVIIHTVRAVGAVTQAMRRLKPGDILGVRGPYGTNWPVDKVQGKDVIIAAGGIGLAPLRPAMYYIMSHRQKYRKVILLYGARTPDELIFRNEVRDWRSSLDLEINVTVDRASSDWRGNVGVVTTLIPRIEFDPANTIALICGPEVMIRFTILALQKCTIPLENIFVSMERNMKCGVGLCGHCQHGPHFICKDGPVFKYTQVKDWMNLREI